MGGYAKLKAAIAAAIKANGNNEITGAKMQVVLNTIVSTVGANRTFVGIANENTNPGTPDSNVFYIAYKAGNYVNFGGIQIDDSVFILQNKNDSWESVDIGIVIRDFTNTKVFTKNFNANKVIRKLFIDTSEYSGSLSLDGLKIKIIAKNVGGLYGIQLRNSANEMIVSPWMGADNSIQSVTVDGIYIYVEYNWENMNDGQLGGSPFILTNEAFNSANDPRGSITNEKIANDSIDVNKIQDNAITTNKVDDKAIEESKLSDEVSEKLNNPTMKLTPNFLNFNVSNLFNVLDYEGFNENPDVWKVNDGTGINPIITIEEQSNILGLKYSRCFSIKDELYKGSYYKAPYLVLMLKALKGIKTKSFCFFVNIQYLYGKKTGLYSAFNGGATYQLSVSILWGTDTKKENSKSVAGTTSYLSCNITYLDFNNQKWAFVRGKFWVDDVSAVIDDTPTFLMGFVGGQEHIGEKTITCGWTFVAGDYDLLPFQYYPYNKNFFELFTEQNIPDGSITTNKIKDNVVTQEKIESNVNLSTTTLTNGLYGQAGDSISEGAGLQTLLPDSDPYAPISGTKKATYGYYIAKLNRMRWANYGKSGSTLGFVVANGSNKNGFSKENGRYTQMDNDLTHLSIFFGWNDSYYGPIMKREDWLFDTYGTKIYYPRTPDLIGTNASDGTPYTTQEQYEAVNAVTGNVGGIDYDNSNSYFNALYVGTKDDNTNKTFWGAWNIVLPYLIEKYPFAKILLIVPFGTTDLMRQCVRDAAQKYGLTYYDFSSINNQLFYQWDDNKPNGMVAGKTISQFRIDNLTYDGLHPDEEGYKYLYPSINAKLMSM